MKWLKWIAPLALVLLLTATCIHVLSAEPALPLAGRTILLDGGHGGKDDGAQREEVKEDEINLAIVQKIEKLLIEQGANVILTRDGDYDLALDDAENRKREDMKQRVALIGCGFCDYFISIHLNAYPNSGVYGAQVFYQETNTQSKALAECLQQQLSRVSQSDMSAKPGAYYILEKSAVPGVLAECGFLSNEKERSLLKEESYQQELAQAIVEGVLAYEKAV